MRFLGADVPENIGRALKSIWGPLERYTNPQVVDLGGRRMANAHVAENGADLATLDQVSDLIATAIGAVATGDSSDPSMAIRIAVFTARGGPAAYRGGLFAASDRNNVVWASNGAAWIYVAGTERNTLANLRTGLTTNDAGYLFFVTDYSHTLRWTGSAWEWAPGDDGSGYYQLFEAAPAGYGANAWQLCDGSSNVPRLNADGSTTNVTVDNVSTARYLKGGTTSAGVVAASGNTSTDSAGTTGNNSASVAVQSGAGTTVAADPHTHSGGSHNHGPGTLELANLQKRLYFRR